MESNTYIFSLITLGILGMLFWSFSSVLLHRWREHKGGIFTGRSECPRCGHTLTAIELIPLVSYILQKASCKKCHTHIPIFYPLLEVGMGLWFVLGWWLISRLGIPLVSVWALWILVLLFITALYVIYDVLYMEIPDQALVPGIILSLIVLGFWAFSWDGKAIFFSYIPYMDEWTILVYALLGAWALYTFFYLQILIPGAIHLIQTRKYSKVPDLFLSYFLLPIHMITFGKIIREDPDEEEIPSWIGWWDLRIALFIGLTLWLYHSIISLGISYVIGALFGICYIIIRKNRKAVVPFGPFLALGWIITFLLYKEITDILYYTIF